MEPFEFLKTVLVMVLNQAAIILGLSSVDKAKALVGMALDFAPVDVLKFHLDAEAKRRDEVLADAAAAAKFTR